jgi:Rod binding domain-containing protein
MMPLPGPVPVSQVPASGTFRAAASANSRAPVSAQLSKLRKAAGEFESILLESLWKSMKDTFSDPEDEAFDPTLRSFDEWGMQAMASAVGSSGGLGIKNMILKHLEPLVAGGGQAPTPSR